MKSYIYIFILFSLTLTINGCQNLEVDNPNHPDQDNVLTDASSLKNLAGSIFQNWYLYNVGYEETPAFMLGTAADATSSSWGNFGMQDMSYEPRIEWNNLPSYMDSDMTEEFFNNMYSLLSQSNDVLTAIRSDSVINAELGQDREMVKAVARLGQGIALGYIGLVFDQGYIVKEDVDLTKDIELQSYDDVIEASIRSLDQAIEIAQQNYFVIPEEWINGSTMNSERFRRLANFMAAKILLSEPRNSGENEYIDRWEKILGYAKEGIVNDYTITADNSVGSWASLYHFYATNTTWGRVDMRVVSMIDTCDLPPVWPEKYQGDHTRFSNQGVAYSPDDRLEKDFQFMATHFFSPDRGYYHYSTYRYKRFDDLRQTGFPGQGTIPLYRKAENDYMLAEAYARTNQVTEAIEVMNDSECARIDRGGEEMAIDEENATKQDVLDAIFYERTIELFSNNLGIQFFDMRRNDKLQIGTPLHLPVPGAELETLEMENYTYGGVNRADGENTSDGGWKEEYYEEN
ncbi:MAG: RagB/SusD family nutrient uptake outer membrane protein [Bacteroidales bacterium]